MILSDVDIKRALASGHLVVAPCDVEEAVQPVSIDLRLGDKLRVFRQDRYPVIDVKQQMDNLTDLMTIDEINPFILHPNSFALGITEEWIELPNDLMGRLDGKSSLGRLGLLVHSTAGFIDPGFKGSIVLEFSNVSPLPITLYAGMPIAQISFYQLTSPAEMPYGHAKRESKYQNQDGPAPSRYYLNFQGKSGKPAERNRHYPTDANALKQWLDDSAFHGDVGLMADELGMPRKTVEDWVYGRYAPNASHRAKLHELTDLAIFEPYQRELMGSESEPSE